MIYHLLIIFAVGGPCQVPIEILRSATVLSSAAVVTVNTIVIT